ncbi:unnamed protein product [Prunus armeniaca]
MAFQRAPFVRAGCGAYKPRLALRQNQPLHKPGAATIHMNSSCPSPPLCHGKGQMGGVALRASPPQKAKARQGLPLFT